MSKRVVVLMFGVSLSLMFLIACGATVASGEEHLPNSSWNLTALEGSAPIADTFVTLNFDENLTAFGSDGCNNYRTTATVDGANLTFAEPGAATLMACDEPIMNQASSFREALAATASFSATAEELMLMDGDGNELAAFAVQSQELSGTSWIVTSYNNGREAVVGVLEGTEMTATFGDDGEVNGTAGCNNYFASFEADAEASTISIGETGMTDMACLEPEGVMEQEQAFLAALATAATYSIQGGTLEMRTADDALAVIMQAIP